MNESSICARWRTNHWDCEILDSVICPTYWSPPLSPGGEASLKIVAFHASIPRAGYTFERPSLGAPWVRTA